MLVLADTPSSFAMPEAFPGLLDAQSSDGIADSQATASAEVEMQWEQRGGLVRLSMEFAVTVGAQALALGAVINQVYYSRSLLMSCDSRKTGMTVAVLCEYTKAYVRCFPLLAIVVSLIVASRMLLCQRMYYKVLKKGAILDFHKFKPLKDQLYLALCWSAGNAFMHFVLELSISHPITPASILKLGITEKALMAEIHKVASLYVLPSLVFLGFLYASYDEEARLLPLSKYFEENPALARKALADMHFLPEHVAARVVRRHEVKWKDANGNYHTSDEIFTLFIKQCKTYKGSSSETMAEGALEQYSHIHLIAGMWPGRLLLDDRLADDGSYYFRIYWFAATAVGMSIMMAICALFAYTSWNEVHDIQSGQKSDLAALIVQMAHCIVLLYVGPSFVNHTILPYIGQVRKLLKWHYGK